MKWFLFLKALSSVEDRFSTHPPPFKSVHENGQIYCVAKFGVGFVSGGSILVGYSTLTGWVRVSSIVYSPSPLQKCALNGQILLCCATWSGICNRGVEFSRLLHLSFSCFFEPVIMGWGDRAYSASYALHEPFLLCPVPVCVSHRLVQGKGDKGCRVSCNWRKLRDPP